MRLELKCCGKIDPLGVDKQNIRLSFALSGSLEIASYEVKLWEKLTGNPVCRAEQTPADGFTYWVDPDCLRELTEYGWQVTAYLKDGQSVLSDTACFETGLDQWTGQWITGQGGEGRVLAFQKLFRLSCVPKKARLYICGLGYFSARVNGRALDDSYFIPPVTDYSVRQPLIQEGSHISSHHRVNYYTYDVTHQLKAGENALYAEVAGGYYSNQEKKDFEPQPDLSFGQACLVYELHWEDESGRIQKIVSGTDTFVRCTNETAQLYSGDRIDFTEKLEEYAPAHPCTPPTGKMTAPLCQGDKVQKRIFPVTSWETDQGTVYDFGVNHSGGLCFTAEAAEEAELTIRYAEVLRPDGTLNFETAAWNGKHNETGQKKQICQQNTYRLRKGSNYIAPKFSWFCYRYVLIPRHKAVRILQLCSLFIHMDMQRDGIFQCGDDLLCRINDVFLQTLSSNMHSGLVMDCPHRERLPYTGDGKLVMKSTCYNFDAAGFYYKWFEDLLDAQTAEGLIPNSAPYMGGGGGYAWGNAICTVSRLLYAYTGDLTVARRGYEAVKRWLGYYRDKRDENYIIRSNSHTWMLGDWLAPYTVTSNVYYISTVCYLQAVKTALFFAELIDKARCGQWTILAQNIIDGINRVFFDERKCIYGNGVQGENMLALAEGIVPEEYRLRMENGLRHHYSVETDHHLDTGVVLTPILLDYLTDHGFRDIDWKIMTARTYPSYFSLMENDTTFSEHWSKKWPDYYFGEPGNSRLVKGGGELSHCHPMYGSVAAWLYERVAGLDLSELYQNVVHIRPYFMDYLPWAKAQKKTVFGDVSVAWKNEENQCTLQIEIPQGLTARCHFPAVTRYLVNTLSGQRYEMDKDGFYDFTLPSGKWHLEGTNEVTV